MGTAGSDGEESACRVGDPASIPGLGGSLEESMATDSTVLAWRIPWTEGPSGAAVHGVAESRTGLSNQYFHTFML